jgi:mannosyltransferase OCH1-like enzyme
MIPKTIHYIWFGNNPKNDDILDCISSWEQLCPGFKIVEWNELNFPIEKYPFASRAYNEKLWAYAADYARLQILEEHGGFYLDTDMLLCQSLSPLTDKRCVIGEESPGILNAAIMGAEPHHPFIQALKKEYDDDPEQKFSTIPLVMSKLFSTFPDKTSVTVYPPKTFYPFTIDEIKTFHGQDLGPDVIGVHLWHYSWGSPLNKFFKKIGIHKIGKKILEALGLKTFFKRLFGFI